MADLGGASADGSTTLNLNAEEKRAYAQLFKEADPDGFGAVSGDVAVKFFEKTKLPADVLGQIWQIADTENRGFLTVAGFHMVLRLIGHAQAGRTPTTQLANSPAPLPRFEGQAPVIAPQSTGPPSSPSQANAGPIRVPALSPEKVYEYSGLFEKSGAENGALSGTGAKQIFERARLPNEVLGRIWTLADTQGRGSLDVTEFVIAMHLLASYKSGAMRGVPTTLPPGLYDAASRRTPQRVAQPPPGIPPQFTGYSNARPQSPVVGQQAGAPLSAQSTGDGWVVSPADKARFDSIFATVDTQGRGFVDGEQAVQFFGNARLPEDVLAQVWDLADIDSDGQLTRDEFAVAMFLIRQQRGTKDGRGNLPPTLPPALIPPSMRRQQMPVSQPTAPVFDNAPVTKPRSAVDDLFGLDVTAPTQSVVPAATQIAQSTGGTDSGPFANPRSPAQTALPSSPALAGSKHFTPFVPNSSFGQSITSHQTGSVTGQQTRAAPQPSANDDLLGDADPGESAKLTTDTTELANLSNQVGNLSKQMTEVQGNRAQAEQELAQNASRKRDFEARLAQLRSVYEKEVQEVRTLQEQLATSRTETKRLQQDIAMIEGTHADLQTQHQQIRSALEADQQENGALKEKIRQTNVEIEQLKPQAEKAKSEARQQKGLVAINKKQLATNDLERDRLKAEIVTAQQEHQLATKEIEESERQLGQSQKDIEASRLQLEQSRRDVGERKRQLDQFHREIGESKRQLEQSHEDIRESKRQLEQSHKDFAESKRQLEESHQDFGDSQRHLEQSNKELEDLRDTPVPAARSPPVVSPALSTHSNPFFRRAGAGAADAVFSPPMGSRVASPQPAQETSTAFDNIFGPSFGTASAALPTSFRPDAPTGNRGFSGGSETPQVVEPPAPAKEHQIKSSALPFRAPLDRMDSVNSSVRVAAPGSRVSPGETPRALTPDTSTASPSSHRADDPFHAAAPDEEQESVRRTLPRGDTQERIGDIPGAFPSGDVSRSATPAQLNPTAIAAGAGAATVAAGVGLAAAAASKSDDPRGEDKGKGVSSGRGENAPQASDFDDFFGGSAHARTPSQQAADFDSAFADMKPVPKQQEPPKSGNQEFPDIQEFDVDDDDDDDDSSDDGEGVKRGFEDDFGAAPHVPASDSVSAGKKPEVPLAIPSHLQTRPELNTANSTASSLPEFEQQLSPPGYKDVVPDDNPNHFPREYKGLLPEREDPTSPTLGGAGSSHLGAGPAPPPAYGPESGQSRSMSQGESAMPPPNKAAPFDFDAAFSGMGAAPVEDDSDSDYGEESATTRQPEFDPTFDSPVTSSHNANGPSSARPFSAHDAVTSPSSSTLNGTTIPPYTSSFSPVTGSNDFSGYGQASSPNITAGTTRDQPPVQDQAPSHDWDALFAPLSSPVAGGNAGSSFDNTQNIGFAPSAATATPASAVDTATGAAKLGGGRSHEPATSAIPAAAAGVPSSTATQKPTLSPPASHAGTRSGRPAPGRALSTGTEHDDPILKRLTAMGWSREESLLALERFDYNIDKAADYLTFKS